jgi:acetamidase/formamidase
VPPGPHAGNLDLSELSEGSTLYIPVWKPGALIYTGDSHAVQGDGEISLTALETRMKELRTCQTAVSRPLSGVKQTSQLDRAAAANDPKRTLAHLSQ